MDRVTGPFPGPGRTQGRRLGVLAFFLLVAAILAYKSYDQGWFLPRTPLALNSQPTVLFFNRHKGCDCAVVVYQAAARQLREWPEAKRQGLELIQVDLDRRPDLGLQFGVARAPALLLVDGIGNVAYRQEEVVTDLQPLNLQALEAKIREVMDAE